MLRYRETSNFQLLSSRSNTAAFVQSLENVFCWWRQWPEATLLYKRGYSIVWIWCSKLWVQNRSLPWFSLRSVYLTEPNYLSLLINCFEAINTCNLLILKHQMDYIVYTFFYWIHTVPRTETLAIDHSLIKVQFYMMQIHSVKLIPIYILNKLTDNILILTCLYF